MLLQYTYLDQQMLRYNAYVSGMKEEHGNELNYITTSWTVGYVIGQIPATMLVTRVRPSIFIPFMEVVWSVLTMCLAASTNFSTLCALRFLVGLAESSFYPAIQYVIGSWYKPNELAKRACIFHTASAIGPMISGFLQAGAYDGLNNVYGLAGWKWLFIIDGIITVPIALLGFLIMPDLPSNTRPSMLYTQSQIDIGKRRMEEVGRKPPAPFTRAKVLGFFKTWHFNNGGGTSTSMIFWLQSFNTPTKTVYTVAQINTYPLGINAIQVVTTLTWAWWSDSVRSRWPPILFAGTWAMITNIVLASTPLYTHITRRWVFYYFTLVQGGLSGIILTWANELTGHDSEKRSFVVASCNTFAYVTQAWLPMCVVSLLRSPRFALITVYSSRVIFPQVEQPRYVLLVTALVVRFLQRHDEKKAAALRTKQALAQMTL
ncbi:MFS general substrate transporter [Amylocystis lapponica]|nr:MFS general substrate transporter [Amylocystis lapponica]